MTSQVIPTFQIEPHQPFMLRDILPGPAWAPFRPVPDALVAPAQAAPVQQCALPAATRQHRWATALAAVCIEVAIPLGVFGIWQLWMHAR